MPIKNKKTKTGRTILLILLVIILLAATGVASFFITKAISDSRKAQDSSETSDSSNSKTSGSSDGKSDPQKTEPSEESNSEEEVNPQKPAQYDGEDPNKQGTLSGVITYAGVSEGSFLVNVSVDQYVSGTCEILLYNSAGQKQNYSTEIIAGPTSGFCSYEGPIPPAGKWDITVTINGDGKSGSVSGEVQI